MENKNCFIPYLQFPPADAIVIRVLIPRGVGFVAFEVNQVLVHHLLNTAQICTQNGRGLSCMYMNMCKKQKQHSYCARFPEHCNILHKIYYEFIMGQSQNQSERASMCIICQKTQFNNLIYTVCISLSFIKTISSQTENIILFFTLYPKLYPLDNWCLTVVKNKKNIFKKVLGTYIFVSLLISRKRPGIAINV